MPKICYVAKRFRVDALAMIAQTNAIIEEYQAQNLILTL
jgi:hypothetical protein